MRTVHEGLPFDVYYNVNMGSELCSIKALCGAEWARVCGVLTAAVPLVTTHIESAVSPNA